MKRAFIWAADCCFLMRIPLLLPVWTVLLLGWVTGSPDARLGGRATRHWSWWLGQTGPAILWVVLTGFSLVVAAIYIMNQIADIDSDRINHKLFLLPHGILSVRTAWALTALCLAGGMTVGVMTGMRFLVLFGIAMLIGVFYNFPPASLKDRAWGGVVANCLGHGLLTYLVGWFVAKADHTLTMELVADGMLSAVSPMLANGAVFLATTIPDVQGDAATGKHTFCVRYGQRTTAIVAALFCLGAFIAAFAMQHNGWVMSVPAAASLLLFVRLAVTSRPIEAFRTFRWPVVLLSVTVLLMVPVYGMLVVGTFLVSRVYYAYRFGISYPTLRAR